MRRYAHRAVSTKKSLIRLSPLMALFLVLSVSIIYTRYDHLQAEAYAGAAVVKEIQTNPSRNHAYSTKPLSSSTSDNSAPTTTDTKAPSSSVTTPIAATTDSQTASAVAPLSRDMSLFANPASNVAIQSRAWAVANPGDAGRMNRLAAVPMATWLGEWSGDVSAAANAYVGAATAIGQMPVVVAYNIPERDCGSYSAGGSADAAAYQTWVNRLATGIGQRQAIVIVEPDALAGMDCLNSADRQSRLQLLSYAVRSLRTQTKAAIYLDAGNPGWQSAGTMAERLKAAGIVSANGFSLNVSNFLTTDSNTNYGNSLSGLVGGKHFVIDTSRNGNGPANGDQSWCNPDGRQFGNNPSLQTGKATVDAYLWVKSPGESDGSCGVPQLGVPAPAAGVWWPQYVLTMAGNSNW